MFEHFQSEPFFCINQTIEDIVTGLEWGEHQGERGAHRIANATSLISQFELISQCSSVTAKLDGLKCHQIF